jgi:hypothetical protein
LPRELLISLGLVAIAVPSIANESATGIRVSVTMHLDRALGVACTMTKPSNASPLRGVQACLFDAYDTLFDFAAAARKRRYKLGDDIDRLTTLWRDKQLQYTRLRAAQGRLADFWRVTADALDFSLANDWPKSPDLRGQLMTLTARSICFLRSPMYSVSCWGPACGRRFSLMVLPRCSMP